MINVSKEFLELMQTRTDFKQYADITFVDGTTLTLEAKDFTIGNNSVNEASDSDSLPLGASISRKIKICLMNNTDQYSAYDFVGAKIRLYLKYELSTTTETINFGTFTVTDPETYGVTITITAYDDMYKADKPYTTGLSFPQTAGAMLRDICTTCGISLYSATFRNDNYVITAKPDGNYTCRQVIGWIAMIAGGNARINRSGSLEIISYDFSKVSQIIDGGTFEPWTQGDSYDGGSFNPWTTGDVFDGGSFGDRNNIHVLHAFKNLTVDTDDIVITGVSMKEDEETVLYGEEGYLINVENPLVTDKRYFVQLLGDVLIGARFRKFSGDHIAYPLAEAMDLAIVLDRKGNAYSTIITDVNFVFFGFTTLKNSAASAIRNSSKYNSQSVQTYVKSKELIKKQKTEFDKAIEDLSFKLSQTEGAYTTIETLSSGGKIFYLHNKPTVAESQMIWKMTAEAWGVSTDGGKTWNAGMTVDGVVIARILNTIGINADWINTGALTVKDSNGNLIFEVNKDTNTVYISGTSVTIGGKTATQAVRDAVTEAETYSDEKLADYAQTVTKDIQSLQTQIDGQIEQHFYEYEPTLNNIPASEWTTEELRAAHEGDLFMNTATGTSYRFLKTNGVWGWKVVEDTEVSKALALAQTAKDTADGKRRVFVTNPYPPYDVGDLWSQSSSDGGNILTCKVSRSSGNYVASDWAKYNKYTDDTAANKAQITANNANTAAGNAQSTASSALDKANGLSDEMIALKTQEAIFNLLTNNGALQGLYMLEGNLYLNASYVKSGAVSGQYIDAKNLKVTDTSGNTTLEITSAGKVKLSASEFSLSGKTIEEIVKEESNLLNDNFTYSGVLTKAQSDPDGGRNAVRLEATSSDSFYSSNASTNKPIKSAGQTYTFSVWLKASDATKIKISLGHTDGIIQEVSLTTSWKRYSISAKIDTITNSNHVTIGGWGSFSTSNGAYIYIYNPVVTYANFLPEQVLTQEEIFNILTNDGATKGLYMSGNDLYINATYIETGSLAGWKIDKQNQTLTSPNGLMVLDAANEKIKINGVELKAYGNGLIVKHGLTIETGTEMFSDGTDGFQLLNLGTVTTGNYLRINNNYVSQSSSSSKRYKEIDRVLTNEDVRNAYNIDVYLAKYKDDYLSKNDERYKKYMPMFVVENMEEYLPIAVDHTPDGTPEMWNSQIMIPIMFQMLKSQKNMIDTLTDRLNKLENLLSTKGVI